MKLTEIKERIFAAYEARRELPREHLGCSIAGKQCARSIWYDFRWATKPHHSGRVLRLFQRGHDEEARVCDDLAKIGLEVTRRQERVNFGWGVEGSIDGVIVLEGVPTLLEIKTHSKKSFAASVKTIKEEHVVQMQLYMLALGLAQALYFPVCKDDDDLDPELVLFDLEAAERYRDRAIAIAAANEAPPRIADDATFFACRMCDHSATCYRQTDSVNCRTCCHSTMQQNGRFVCEKSEGREIPVEFSRVGCDSHVMHPSVVPSWERLESIGEWAAPYRLPDGREIINGDPAEIPGAVTSWEMI